VKSIARTIVPRLTDFSSLKEDDVKNFGTINRAFRFLTYSFLESSYSSRSHGCGIYSELIFVDSKAEKGA